MTINKDFSTEAEPFVYRMTAGYADSFRRRSVQPGAVMTYLEESAAEHCRSIGLDVFTLMDRGEGWVLTGGGLRMFRYPRYGEELRVETWVSDRRAMWAIREYRIYGSDDSLLAEAGGRWVYWDVNSRKPLPIPAAFKDGWGIRSESPYRNIFPFSPTPEIPMTPDSKTGGSTTLTVRRSDVDLYGHLHNTVYMDWLMEAVPEDLYQGAMPMELGMRFFGEALLGDEVRFDFTECGDRLIHEARRLRDNALLIRGYSQWIREGDELTA